MFDSRIIKPGLFAQDHNNSNRDYSQERYWGKNQFNSSFPASLVAYMSYKGIDPVYLKTNADNKYTFFHYRNRITQDKPACLECLLQLRGRICGF